MIFKFTLIYLTWMFALFSVISVILLQLIWIRDLCQSNFTPADGCKNFKLLVVIEIRFLKNFRKDWFLISEQFVSLVIRYCLGCDFFFREEIKEINKLTFACTKLEIETLEKGVKYLQS